MSTIVLRMDKLGRANSILSRRAVIAQKACVIRLANGPRRTSKRETIVHAVALHYSPSLSSEDGKFVSLDSLLVSLMKGDRRKPARYIDPAE
jgi:hypothetical protein